MPKRKYPTKTAIKKALAQCVTDPNVPGPISIIAESGPDYWVPRAGELLREAAQSPRTSGHRQSCLEMAAALIGLALAGPVDGSKRASPSTIKEHQQREAEKDRGVYKG